MTQKLPFKITLLLLTLISLFFLFHYFSQEGIKKQEAYKIKKYTPEESGENKLQNISERMKQELEQTRNPFTLDIPQDALMNAQIITQLLFELNSPSVAVNNLNWENRGPSNVGGRTRAIMFDLSDASNNTVFAGGVGGGLWKTTNFQSSGASWSPIGDFFENIAITSIIQDAANHAIMYFGTGEGWFNSDAIRGLGIWKSIDGGDTWNQLSATNNSNFYYIQDLLIDQNGYLYAATKDAGVQRSITGGTSFTQVLGSSVGAGATNRAADLEVGPDGDIYASLGIFSTGSVYHSADNLGTNTGAVGNWTNVTPLRCLS